MYAKDSDVLERSTSGKSIRSSNRKSEKSLTRPATLPPPLTLVLPNNATMSYPLIRVKEVPDLDNVQPFYSDPILADDIGNSENRGNQPEETLTTHRQPMPCLYGNRTSIAEMIINNRVKRALATAWAFDPRACSTTAAQKQVTVRHHGLTEEEYTWTRGNRSSLVAEATKERRNEGDLAKQCLDWEKNWVAHEPYPSFGAINLDRELDAFYGTEGTTQGATTDQFITQDDPLATDNDQMITSSKNVDRDSMSTTWVTLPQSDRIIAGPLTSCTFQDSAIHMEDHFAEEANKGSPPDSACQIPTKPVSDRQDNSNGQLVERSIEDCLAQYDFSMHALPGSEFEAPYDFSGFVSSESDLSAHEDSGRESGDVEMNEDDNSAIRPGAASPSGLRMGSEESPAPHAGSAPSHHIHPSFDGYLHNVAITPRYVPFGYFLMNNRQYETGFPGPMLQQGSCQLEALNPPFTVYNQRAPGSPNDPSRSSTQLLADLQAQAGASSYDRFTNDADRNYRLVRSTPTTIARQGRYQNLTPELNSDSGVDPDSVRPPLSATLTGSNQSVSNHGVSADLNNPYDHRHYLPSDVPQFLEGMDLESLASSSAHNTVLASETNETNAANIDDLDASSVLVQPSLHFSTPTINHVPSSPTTIPPSSPPVLQAYIDVLNTPAPQASTLSSPACSVVSTPTPVMMGKTDPVSPSPAPKNQGESGRLGIWPEGKDADGMTMEGENEPVKTAVKDVFGVQQKRRVGRPVGSKSVKKNGNASATKETAKSDAEGSKKKATDKTGDAGSELKKVLKASSASKKTQKKGKAEAIEAAPAAANTPKLSAATTEQVAENKTLKHKQASPVEESEPKKKRVRRPSRKSVEEITAAKK